MKPTKEQIINELRSLSKQKPDGHTYGGSSLWPSRWMPNVLVRKALLKRVTELLEKGE